MLLTVENGIGIIRQLFPNLGTIVTGDGKTRFSFGDRRDEFALNDCFAWDSLSWYEQANSPQSICLPIMRSSHQNAG
jgi:hypothetical protein